MFWVLFSCSGEKAWNIPVGPNQNESVSPELEEPAVDGFQEGDPIEQLGFYPSWDNSMDHEHFYEWVDAAIINDSIAIQGGVTGLALVSREDGEIIELQQSSRVYRVDSDGQHVIVGSRTSHVSLWQVSGESLQSIGFLPQLNGVHEDVAVYDGLIAVGWRSDGVKLYDTDLQLLTSIPAEDAFAVGIANDALVYSDADELVLCDVGDGRTPQELHRVELPAEGRDISFDGTRVAVGMGGDGVAIYEVQADQLQYFGRLSPSGTALSVALDGEYLWTATWNTVLLSYLGGDTPINLGEESPVHSAMGIAASNGNAVVADWYKSTVMSRNDGYWGAEVDLPSELFFSKQDPFTQVLPIRNSGAIALEVQFTEPGQGFVINDTVFTIAPSEVAILQVTSSGGDLPDVELTWSSNDPDEETGVIRLISSDSSVGSAHPEFELPLVSAEYGLNETARLSDYQGQILFLAWWADF